jgi:aspartyl-tRNA(Asn)/glutamyl-tRNA(Gln) amidotransferase subunit C
MTREELAHLARLSRIALTPDELTHLEGELSSIVEYVSTVNAIAAEGEDVGPTVPALRNVFRADVVTNEPDSFSATLIEAFPDREGRYLKVKKILDTHG